MSEKHDSTNMGFVILISVTATIGGFLFGFDSGVINGTVVGLQTAFDLTAAEVGSSVASMLLGCAAGAFFAFISIFFVFRFVHETKGIELEDMKG